MLNWTQKFNIFCFLDSHQYNEDGEGYDCILAAGTRSIFKTGADDFSNVDDYTKNKQWIFGHLSYELKNQFFPPAPLKPDQITFPVYFFFEPEVVIAIRNGSVFIDADDAASIYDQIINTKTAVSSFSDPVHMQGRFSKQAYVGIIRDLKQHIQMGDCYEINFCQEFFAENAQPDLVSVYRSIAATSPAPFAAFYRVDDDYLICASPERFLSKKGERIIAQPMKGTLRRGGGSGLSDAEEKKLLHDDQKERSENVMIVDLMRNDLSRVCKRGSVKVSELFGVYSFPHVHQMVSTVEGELEEGAGFCEIMKACFPMGSMTGAPKYRVIELIDQYEQSPRGIFSGSLGYFHDGDFDFNVVIRSLMYNCNSGYLSLRVGSGITIYSDPEKEWEECIVKAEAIKKVLAEPALRR